MEFMSKLEDGSLGISSDDDLRNENKVNAALTILINTRQPASSSPSLPSSSTNTSAGHSLSIPDTLHLIHIALLYHWEYNRVEVVKNCLDLLSKLLAQDLLPLGRSHPQQVHLHFSEKEEVTAESTEKLTNHHHHQRNSGVKGKLRSDEALVEACVPVLDQLAHQLVSYLQYNQWRLPWLYTSSTEIHRQLCELILAFIDYDERYLIKFGESSVVNNNTHIVHILALHRKALEDLLIQIQTFIPSDESPSPSSSVENESSLPLSRDEVKQLLIYHIKAIAGLSKVICKLSKSFDNQLFMSSHGICQELYTIFNLFPAILRELSEQSMGVEEVHSSEVVRESATVTCLVELTEAIYSISQNGKNKTLLGELGMNLLLLESLEKYHDVKELVIVTCQCMRHLSMGKIATERVKLGAAGACTLLTKILKQHKDDTEITKEISTLIWVVADYWKNKIEFSDAGAYQTLFVLLKLYREEPDVLEPALGALSAIAVNKDDQFFLKECGVCDMVVELLQRHLKGEVTPQKAGMISSGLVQQACALIWSLSLHEDNQFNFHDIHTLELLWKVLQMYNKDVLVLEQVLGAMEALNRNLDGLSMTKLWKFAFQGDQKDILVELLMLNATYGDVIEKICIVIKHLIVVEEFKYIFTHNTFIFDVLSDCMEFHAANSRLLKMLEDLRMNFIVY